MAKLVKRKNGPKLLPETVQFGEDMIPDKPQTQDKQTKNFLDTILETVQNAPISLDALEEAEDEEGEENKKERSLLSQVPQFHKQYYTKSDKKLVGEISKFCADQMNLTKNRKQTRETLLSMRKDLICQYGDNNICSASQLILIDSLVFLSLIEFLISSSSLRWGVLRLNRSNKSLVLQPAIEKNLIGIIGAKRLCLKTLSDISKEKITKKMVVNFQQEKTDEEITKELAELNAILPGFPKDAIKSISLSETREA